LLRSDNIMELKLTKRGRELLKEDKIERLKLENITLKAEIERLKEALKKYGRHLYDCEKYGNLSSFNCTCEFEQALKGGE